jgi:hypothetical protein
MSIMTADPVTDPIDLNLKPASAANPFLVRALAVFADRAFHPVLVYQPEKRTPLGSTHPNPIR